jgi:hypothetical protein
MRGEDSRGKSPEFFREGFKDVFNPEGPSARTIDEAIYTLYEEVRCGLFHTGMPRGKVILSGGYENPVEIELDQTRQDGIIRINPHKLLDKIEAHLSNYVTRLRDPKEKQLRDGFERAWRLRFGLPTDPVQQAKA